jgi:hypothetical protein
MKHVRDEGATLQSAARSPERLAFPLELFLPPIGPLLYRSKET